MILWSVHSCFQCCKNYKNRPRNTRVIVENKEVPFLWNTVFLKSISSCLGCYKTMRTQYLTATQYLSASVIVVTSQSIIVIARRLIIRECCDIWCCNCCKPNITHDITCIIAARTYLEQLYECCSHSKYNMI